MPNHIPTLVESITCSYHIISLSCYWNHITLLQVAWIPFLIHKFFSSLHLFLLTPSPTHFITGFSVCNRATDFDDRKFTTEYCIFVGRNLVSWSSKKQKLVFRRSTEVKYRSVATALSDIIWIQSLMTDLHITSSTPTLYYDNLDVVQIAANPVMHSCSTLNNLT